ncbi:MAG: nucleoside hydrolase [Chloroflexota bacterium]
MKKVIIDTDPGIDDCAALFFALAGGQLDVLMLTTVFGNSTTDNTTRNALRILEAADRTDIPVYRGASKPLLREPTLAPQVHGEDGMGDVLQGEPRLKATPGRAVDKIIEAVLRHEGDVDLLALGPLTNVALAISIEPAVAKAVRSLVVMGGAVRTRGNVTPVATANLANDPEAAAIVYRSGAPIVQIGMDVCRPTLIADDLLDEIRDAGTPMTEMLTEVEPHITAYYRRAEGVSGGTHFNDLPATAYLVVPELFKTEHLPVRIETTGTLSYGQTVVDWRGRWGMAPNATVALEVEARKLAELFTQTLTNTPTR